jgi:hypothetical protein
MKCTRILLEICASTRRHPNLDAEHGVRQQLDDGAL